MANNNALFTRDKKSQPPNYLSFITGKFCAFMALSDVCPCMTPNSDCKYRVNHFHQIELQLQKSAEFYNQLGIIKSNEIKGSYLYLQLF